MDKQVSESGHRVFRHSDALFDVLDGSAAAAIASISSDIVLSLDESGRIRDVAYRDAELKDYGLDDWIGRPWEGTVTPESVDKIADLMAAGGPDGSPRARQVNHPAPGLADLPVAYRVFIVPGIEGRLALGEDQRRLAEIQQRLVQTQLELEKEYRTIREAETRYRTVFQKSDRPMLIVNGADRRITDANLSGADLFDEPVRKLIGTAVSSIVARDDREDLLEVVGEAVHGGVARNRRVRIAGSGRPVSVAMEPFRENGQTNLILRFADVSASGQNGEDAASEPGNLIEGIPEALVTVDAKGIIAQVNDRFLDIVHVLNARQLIGRNLNEWLGASTVDMQVLLSRVREEGQLRQFATVIRDDLGASVPVYVSAMRHGAGSGDMIRVLVVEQRRQESPLPVAGPGLTSETSDFSELVGRVPLKDLIRESVDVIEKLCIQAALKQTNNNRASAADMLGLSRQSLYIKLKRHGLEDFRS